MNVLRLIVFLNALVISALTSAQLPEPAAPVEITQAMVSAWAEPGLPDATANWQSISLPFRNSDLATRLSEQALDHGAIWVRMTTHRPADTAQVSLLFLRYNLSMQAFFNGTEVASNGTRAGRLTTAWNRPLIATIPESLWVEGANEILVRLAITPWGGTLAPVLAGETNLLQRIQEARYFQQVELNTILLAFALTIGIFTLGLWSMRRHDTVYLWFSGICLAWATGIAHTVIYYNPLPYSVWLPVVHTAIDACIFFMYGFIGRLAGAQRPLRERLFLGWTIAGSITHQLMPPELFWYSAYLIHTVGVLVLGVMIFRVTVIAVRQRKIEAIIVSAAIVAQIFLFIVNAFLMFFDNAEAWNRTLSFAYLGIPALLLVFTGVLLRRFTQALATAESLNRNLEHKVEVSRQIIARNFAERRRLEMQQAAQQERQKIYRDLHDDVGSRLLSIIHADTDKKLGDMARSALESLRQAVSRANTPDQTLHDLLLDIAEETRLRLEGSGHQVVWQQTGDIPETVIPSVIAYNINRIMKELVSNIIRHAGAEHVAVEVNTEADSLTITVNDDGRGFLPGTQSGNGLRNIRSRAAEINADVDWHSTPHGTRCRLKIHRVTPANIDLHQ